MVENELEIEINKIEEANTDALLDLPVASSEQIKGGTGTGQGGPVFNHNETTMEDEALEDLPVSEEQQEEITGGGWGYGESTVKLNHNETTVSDEDNDTQPLTDLEPQDEVVGGAKVGAGHLILPNANTYMGTTTIQQGVLN